ncbi:FKBP-type peptidyl-prolyl cis-trans isomerase [Roseateles saccharophilus]|uniref:Peptidyl-prolyl cis-trans isomerase n=1 Tax=Roseateles saccharophilus TaxID=304 RepID=A0A4R3VAH8_ROSSA|nr:FKBP-type peptidyl-prolyl cis-trans isomerase [Roseateles saccharophilus]MDG0831560.1 FKBP-type peptidyl-prolyl cis-trans isomerase [Roseateles saccharophilus]TCV01031.1 FKBP-type peptidyl-prolyl cis-trans isomerase FkpA [Roseateles saccharophilus]
MHAFRSRRLALLLALSASLGLAACGGGSSSSSTSTDYSAYGWANVTALKIVDTTLGTGTQADTTKNVSVNYTGYIYDVRVADTKGTQFDTSVGKTPLTFTLGTGAVIPGFDQGVTGMKVGGKRTITIPATLAYGSTGAGNGTIPANAALVFDIELVSVNN